MFNLEKYDNKIKNLVNKIENVRFKDAREAIAACDDLEEYANACNVKEVSAYAIFMRACSQYRINQIDESFSTLSMALSLLIDTKQWELAARTYSMLGVISSGKGNIPMAIDYYLQGLGICRTDDLLQVSVILNCNIGVLYLGFRDLGNAINYFNASVDKANEMIRLYGSFEPYIPRAQMAMVYHNLAACYCQSNLLEEAKENILVAEKLSEGEKDASLELVLRMLWAQYYKYSGEEESFNRIVKEIDASVDDIGAILDSFDDTLEYCSFLQKAGKEEEFWKLITKLEEQVLATESSFLYRRIVELKINYYKSHGNNKDYLMSAGLYFELSMKTEIERQESYKQSLSVRLKLEEERRNREEVETEAASLRVRSEIDSLTGLRNRFKILSLLEESFNQCVEAKISLAVEILDVDYFKQYNDNYGHQKGDEILRRVSKAIHSLERHRGIYTGRYGGDEFLVIFVDRTREEVEQFAQELKDIIEKENVTHEYSLIANSVMLSQGLFYGVPAGDKVMEDFIEQADKSLYKVKKAGRNSFLVTSEEDEE